MEVKTLRCSHMTQERNDFITHEFIVMTGRRMHMENVRGTEIKQVSDLQ
jgi:hypothetical protein